MLRPLIAGLLATACCFCFAAERRVDPTFLHRNLATVIEKPSDISTGTCHYKPIFGEGDRDQSILASVARFGEVIVDPNGACAAVQYPEEDQVYVVLNGAGSVTYGPDRVSLKKEDYLYLPATISHALSNPSAAPLTVIVMGFRTKDFEKAPLPSKPLKANIEDVPTQPVSGHPASALYRLLMGDIDSKRDRIAAGRVLTSLFVMEIAPGGTNFPHHHEREEEIYLVLDGRGEMVAGGGIDGIEGRHPARAGDAYFFRLNCTIGYYSAPDERSRILAVRSWYPGMAQPNAEH
ncbi:MAG: cupin domain-containing protein [Acidobacteriia bacterium]|nr:cupin domain-containing protein [Terriglobia bacterium]